MFGTTRAILLEHMRTCDKRQAATDKKLEEIQAEQTTQAQQQQRRHEENIKSIAALKVTALWALLGLAGTVLAFVGAQAVSHLAWK